MTKKELETLKSLQAKQKRVQRAEEEFLREADQRMEDLLGRWHIDARLTNAADIIGTTTDDLYEWITSDPQIAYYRRNHPQEQITESTSEQEDNTGW